MVIAMAANKCDKEGMRKVEEAVSISHARICLLSTCFPSPPTIHAAQMFFFFFLLSDLQDGRQYAKGNNIIHLATSAKSGHNVKELFLEIGLLHVVFDHLSGLFTPSMCALTL